MTSRLLPCERQTHDMINVYYVHIIFCLYPASYPITSLSIPTINRP